MPTQKSAVETTCMQGQQYNFTASKTSDVFTLYLNPANTQFGLLQNTEIVDVSMYDMAGKFYLNQIVNGAELINIESLPVGTYNVVIKTNTTEIFKLLIKQ